MAKRTLRIFLGALVVGAATLSWAGSEKSGIGNLANPLNEPGLAVAAEAGPSKPAPAADGATAEAKQGVTAPGASPAGASTPQSPSKSVLAEAFIAQNHLQVYLNGPASISVYNARGQQIFHADSRASMESVSLMGVNTGFLYLTVRAGQTELTRKLVYTGK